MRNKLIVIIILIVIIKYIKMNEDPLRDTEAHYIKFICLPFILCMYIILLIAL